LQSVPGAARKALNQEHPKTLVVKSDNNVYKEIDIETLEPIGVARQERLHPDLKGPMSCAHAQYDPKTGDLFNYNLDFGKVGTYRIFKTSFATGETEILATVSEKAAYIHSFFLTEDFVILAVWSSHYALNGVKILWERNIMDAINPFDPKSLVKWIVIDRKHGKGVVARFESPAMFSFHTVNAWQEPAEKDGTVNIYCDIIQFKNLDILHKFYYDNLVSTGSGVQDYAQEPKRSNISPSFVRYCLANVSFRSQKLEKAIKTPKAKMILHIPSPLVGELPRINPNYFTKKSRFVYSVADEGHSSFLDGLVKLDTETKEATYWRTPKHTPGEAIFIQDPYKEEEDAGYLLSVVLDGEMGTSYLLCLDAKTMKEVGRAECEVPVGFGFHGSHVSI
jgi:torulene dioxygenase